MTIPVMLDLCDCSTNGLEIYRPCYPQSGAGCIQTVTCQFRTPYPYDISKNPYGCTSFDQVAIFRRIQGQSRMPESQYTSGLKAVTVASNFISNKDADQLFNAFQGINTYSENTIYPTTTSRIWGNIYSLRNQSDQVQPSGTLNASRITTIRDPYLNSAITQCAGFRGGCPMATRPRGRQGGAVGSNSTKSTLVSNRPGGGINGFGVDVKHGSYARYLAKKTGKILSKAPVSVTKDLPLSIAGRADEGYPYLYRRGFRDQPTPFANVIYDSAGMNNYVYKFGRVAINGAVCGPPGSRGPMGPGAVP